MTRGSTIAVLAAVALVGLGPACGRKTEVRPPELVAPRSPDQLMLSREPEGVRVRWRRPGTYADGSTMHDLGGFVIERMSGGRRFHEVGRVPVTDRGRFKRQKRFDFLDRELQPETTYHYRLVAFTADGYYSIPSGSAAITWRVPSPTPTPRKDS